jgi:hypothetical protein
MIKEAYRHLSKEVLQDILATLKNNINILASQSAKYGDTATPIYITNQINDTIQEINYIEDEINNRLNNISYQSRYIFNHEAIYDLIALINLRADAIIFYAKTSPEFMNKDFIEQFYILHQKNIEYLKSGNLVMSHEITIQIRQLINPPYSPGRIDYWHAYRYLSMRERIIKEIKNTIVKIGDFLYQVKDFIKKKKYFIYYFIVKINISYRNRFIRDILIVYYDYDVLIEEKLELPDLL